MFGQFENVAKIEHLLSFDVCVLKEEEYLTFNPIQAAISAKENFISEAMLQVDENKYKKIFIRSGNIENNKLLLFSDLSFELENLALYSKIGNLENKINELENNNREFSILKERAESNSIRVSLINKISTSIRDTFDVDEIVSTAISEISLTLGLSKGIFADFDKASDNFISRKLWQNNKKEENFSKALIEAEIIPIKRACQSHNTLFFISQDAPK
ncbi:MAG: hypothetical protein MZU95_04455 [Desulfomicrobium escambiense]|nr:hypothetical protein [Desulfomicrobium escambiense]